MATFMTKWTEMIRMLLQTLDVLSFSHRHTQEAPGTCRKKCKMPSLLSTSVGWPDFFITFTCNPKWVDINSHLLYWLKSSRQAWYHMFYLKIMKMMDIIKCGYIFGPLRWFMYTAEWQRRGLPPVHILLWLQNKLMSTNIDCVINSELPNCQEDPVLFEIIKTSMIYGLCGHLNPRSSCMNNGRRTKHYPRELIYDTQTGDDGYPLYYHWAPHEGGHMVTIKIIGGQDWMSTTDG